MKHQNSISNLTRAGLLSLIATLAGATPLAAASPTSASAFSEALKKAAPKSAIKLNDNGEIIEINMPDSSTFDDEMYRQLGSITTLQKLNLGSTKVTDQQFKMLSPLTKLTKLEFNGGALTDAAFASLAGMVELKALVCWHQGWQKEPTMTGSGLAPLSSLPQLTELVIAGSRISDAAIESIVQIKTIENLEIFHCWNLSDAALLRLKELPKLRRVSIGSVRGEPKGSEGLHVTDALVQMLSTMPTLESLSLSEGVLSYGGSLKDLKNLPALKKLEMSEVEIPAGDLEKLQADLPSVEIKHTLPKEELAKRFKELRDAGSIK